MNTKSIICRGRVRAIEDAVEAWKCDHDDAMEVRDIEDVVRECLWVCELFRSLHQEAWQRAFANQVHNPQQIGEAVKWAFEAALTVLPRVAEWIFAAQQKGYNIDRASDFQQALQDIRRLHQDFVSRWPFFEPRELEEARAQFARGECQPIEEVIRDLQGQDFAPG